MNGKFTTEIDAAGRVSIAPALLSALQLFPGATLTLELQGGRIVLEPLPEDPELVEKEGVLVVRPRITGKLVDSVQQDREERIAQFIEEFR